MTSLWHLILVSFFEPLQYSWETSKSIVVKVILSRRTYLHKYFNRNNLDHFFRSNVEQNFGTLHQKANYVCREKSPTDDVCQDKNDLAILKTHYKVQGWNFRSRGVNGVDKNQTFPLKMSFKMNFTRVVCTQSWDFYFHPAAFLYFLFCVASKK